MPKCHPHIITQLFFASHEKKGVRLKAAYRKYSVSHLPSLSCADGQSHVIVVPVLGIPPSTISAAVLEDAPCLETVIPPVSRRPSCSIWILFCSKNKYINNYYCNKSVMCTYIYIYKKENLCCVSLFVSGTPVSDTVCKRCPAGQFSSSDSSVEPCQPHRNCSHLGLRTLRWGSATSDSLCASQDKTATLDCSQHQALCRNGKRPEWKVFDWKPVRGSDQGASDPVARGSQTHCA